MYKQQDYKKAGLDYAFSAPKPISLLASVGEKKER